MKQEETRVVDHREIQGGYRLLVVDSPLISPEVRPGQFVHLRIPELESRVLRRPFSVYKAEAGRLSILYKAVGRGTEAMKHLVPEDVVSLLGPLGNGFPVEAEGSTPVLVAGGYGMAALYMLAKALPEKGIAFFGGRSKPDILCVDEFQGMDWDVRVTTEDGSMGDQGLVTDAIDAWVKAEMPGTPEFFACGPLGMLQAVGERAVRGGWKAWLSLDRNMGCGVGACLTCVQKIRADDGGWDWKRVCRDGPVFEAAEVVWDE